ncbi:hypothetical protein GCM10011579_083900 [Streptomyces albiflavescens]|uniref:Uncharacterized protein n=1 Tax=Streptomyces albiflavescens TaxID=1623582 RepID=A0A917YCQ6_9ACTN|nr:hypothetical protein GCM10011579_083900 [Streptomyces albiflavescens]
MALLEHAVPSALTGIGAAAEEIGKTEWALQAWSLAAGHDARAMVWVGWFHADRGVHGVRGDRASFRAWRCTAVIVLP